MKLLLLLNKHYNSCSVLAFSTIFFYSRWSWNCSDHFRSFIFRWSFLTLSFHLCLALRHYIPGSYAHHIFSYPFRLHGSSSFHLPPFLLLRFFSGLILWDEVAGLVLNPRYLGGPRFFCRGCLP
jgi:hypothetical protein